MSEPRLPDLARSFERHLRAENKSDRTVETYLEAVRSHADRWLAFPRMLQRYGAAAADARAREAHPSPVAT
jgi:hypothetical protein